MVHFCGMFSLKNTLEGRMAAWESQTGRKQGQKRGHALAWKGPRPTSQAAFQKEEKLITLTTHYVPDSGPGDSDTSRPST